MRILVLLYENEESEYAVEIGTMNQIRLHTLVVVVLCCTVHICANHSPTYTFQCSTVPRAVVGWAEWLTDLIDG